MLGRGDFRAAMVAVDSALSLARATAAGEGDLPELLLHRARVALAMHRYADAERDATMALDGARALAGGDAPSATVGDVYLALGHARRGQGALGDARAAFAAAAQHLRPTVGPDHPTTDEAVRLAAGVADPAE
ncbi:MAG: hypothetical protein ACREOF_04795 [Gemmatimonadales bacterium]